jgi:sugar lactone lactonase YvrE
MRNGAAVEIRTTLTGLTGPVTWSLAPAASGRLSDFPDNLMASYLPISSTPDAAAEKVTITASAGGVSQSIQLDLKPSPQPVPYLDLPKVWTYGPLTDVGYRLTGGSPVASAADQSGNLYLAYSAPVSEIKKVGTDGSITTFAQVDNPGSLAFGPDGVLYVVDRVGALTYAIRRITPDGTMSTLTQTAPFDTAKGTIDGPSGVATAFSLSIVVSPAGAIYATDGSRVRKIAPDGSFSTFAGGGCEVSDGPAPRCGGTVNGRGTEARFTSATSIVIDAAGNLYVSDSSLIRKITPAGDVSIFAGGPASNTYIGDIDGTGSAARFGNTGPMTIDAAGNLYKLSVYSPMLRKITPSGVVSTVAADVNMFYAMRPENNIVSLYAGIPGVVVLQSSAALIKVAVD